MKTEDQQIHVDELVVGIVRKKVRHMHLRVYPPDGRVRVTVPMRVSDETVRRAVTSKLEWIRRQQAKLLARHAGQETRPKQEYLTGESHFFLGQGHRLNVIHHNAPATVHLRDGQVIDLFVRHGSNKAGRERILMAWHRQQLKLMIPPLITKWEAAIGVTVAEWGVKAMKTRWGTCNIRARRIWLSLELSQKSVQCLEYIIVHEMTHLLERRHNDRFRALMDGFMPQWRQYREELNGQHRVDTGGGQTCSAGTSAQGEPLRVQTEGSDPAGHCHAQLLDAREQAT